MWQRRQFIPSLADTVILQMTIAKDAPLGFAGSARRSPERAQQSDRVQRGQDLAGNCAQGEPRRARAYNVINGGVPIIRQTAKEPDPPTEITLPVVVNAQMMPGTSDQYRFHAKKGQHVVVAAAARELIPYVSDAVPGWFQAAIALRDAQGKQVAAADHFLFHPDPLLHFAIPSDGEYIAEIHDSIFRGREDFVYRLTVGELPVITGMFPLGGKTGTRTTVQTFGWNQPSAKVSEDLNAKPAGLYPLSVSKRRILLPQRHGVCRGCAALRPRPKPPSAARPKRRR